MKNLKSLRVQLFAGLWILILLPVVVSYQQCSPAMFSSRSTDNGPAKLAIPIITPTPTATPTPTPTATPTPTPSPTPACLPIMDDDKHDHRGNKKSCHYRDESDCDHDRHQTWLKANSLAMGHNSGSNSESNTIVCRRHIRDHDKNCKDRNHIHESENENFEIVSCVEVCHVPDGQVPQAEFRPQSFIEAMTLHDGKKHNSYQMGKCHCEGSNDTDDSDDDEEDD